MVYQFKLDLNNMQKRVHAQDYTSTVQNLGWGGGVDEAKH